MLVCLLPTLQNSNHPRNLPVSPHLLHILIVNSTRTSEPKAVEELEEDFSCHKRVIRYDSPSSLIFTCVMRRSTLLGKFRHDGRLSAIHFLQPSKRLAKTLLLQIQVLKTLQSENRLQIDQHVQLLHQREKALQATRQRLVDASDHEGEIAHGLEAHQRLATLKNRFDDRANTRVGTNLGKLLLQRQVGRPREGDTRDPRSAATEILRLITREWLRSCLRSSP